MQIDNIVINKIENRGTVKAYVTFVINNSFAVHDARIIDSKNGLFVAMPSKRVKSEFRDVCHPIKQEVRQQIEKAIIEKYLKEDVSNENV